MGVRENGGELGTHCLPVCYICKEPQETLSPNTINTELAHQGPAPAWGPEGKGGLLFVKLMHFGMWGGKDTFDFIGHLSLRHRDAIEDGEPPGGCRWLGWPQHPSLKDRGVRPTETAAAAGVLIGVGPQRVSRGAPGQTAQGPPDAAGIGPAAGGAAGSSGVPSSHGGPRGSREGRGGKREVPGWRR